MEAPTIEKKKGIHEIVSKIRRGQKPLSHSSLEKFAFPAGGNPRKLKEYWTGEFKRTKALIEGDAFHVLTLTPDLFDQKFVVDSLPDANRPTSANQIGFIDAILSGMGSHDAYRANYKTFKEEKADELYNALLPYIEFMEGIGKRDILTKDQYDMICRMRDAVQQNYTACSILEQLEQTEQEIRWENSGFRWRGFLDGNGEVIVDLKKIREIVPRKIKWECEQKGYFRQAAHYTIGAGLHKPYFLIFVDPNFDVAVFKITEGHIRNAWAEINHYVELLHHCMDQDLWNMSYDFYGHQNGIFEI